MSKKKTTCCVCGSEYEVCHFCPEVANFTPWRRICDTTQHYQIYLVLSEYSGKVLSRTDARKQLERLNVNVNNCKTFRPSVYAAIKEIFETLESESSDDLSTAIPSMEQKVIGNDTTEDTAGIAATEPQAKRTKKYKKV